MFLYTQHQKDQYLVGFASLDKCMESKSRLIKSNSYSEAGTQASKSAFQYATGLWVFFTFFFYFEDYFFSSITTNGLTGVAKQHCQSSGGSPSNS